MNASRPLPTGVVTFLLTDIQGSTRLWESEPETMRRALMRHDAMVATGVERQRGHVVKSKGEGDSVFAVFRHARDAMMVAIVIQCALAVEPWPTSTPIRVRMAIHTGPVELREGDYYGPTVNRCARLRALATGGQVLVSGATAQLAQKTLPGGVTLTDLGSKQLKDLRAPERVWELSHPQLRRAIARLEEPRVEKPSQPEAAAYRLTDHVNRDSNGREWTAGENRWSADAMRCYTSPLLAGLLNPVFERFRYPRLWTATVDVEVDPSVGTFECHEVTTVRQVTMPTLGADDFARFAVLCVREAYMGGGREAEFMDWTERWLTGMDPSGIAARGLADDLWNDAQRGGAISDVREEMASHAARAAMHAARTRWMAGRAREQELASATACAADAVRTAMQLANLDLLELAEAAVAQPTVARAA